MYFCKVCSQLDEQGISGHHVRCKPAINSDAINKNAAVATTSRVVEEGGLIDADQVVLIGRTPNRRMRSDYNAYMKEYMRKRRAA